MPTAPAPARRTVLIGAGGLGLTAVLAACGGGSASPTPGGGTTSAGPALAAGTELAAVADVPVGGALGVDVDGAPFLITRPAEDEVHAFSAICTHQGCTVLPGEGELRCPCHGSRYALTDAEVLGGPAPRPLAEVAVEVADGKVVAA